MIRSCRGGKNRLLPKMCSDPVQHNVPIKKNLPSLYKNCISLNKRQFILSYIYREQPLLLENGKAGYILMKSSIHVKMLLTVADNATSCHLHRWKMRVICSNIWMISPLIILLSSCVHVLNSGGSKDTPFPVCEGEKLRNNFHF